MLKEIEIHKLKSLIENLENMSQYPFHRMRGDYVSKMIDDFKYDMPCESNYMIIEYPIDTGVRQKVCKLTILKPSRMTFLEHFNVANEVHQLVLKVRISPSQQNALQFLLKHIEAERGMLKRKSRCTLKRTCKLSDY